jgi:hypothetical protein
MNLPPLWCCASAPRGLRSTQHGCAPVVAPRSSRHAPGPLPASAHTEQVWEPHVSLTSAHSAARCDTHQAPSMRMQKCDVQAYCGTKIGLCNRCMDELTTVCMQWPLCMYVRSTEAERAVEPCMFPAPLEVMVKAVACGHYSNRIRKWWPMRLNRKRKSGLDELCA